MVDAIKTASFGAFQQERTYLGQALGRLEVSDTSGKIGSVRVIKITHGSLLERLLCLSIIIRIFFGNFVLINGYLVSKTSFDGSLLQRKIIQQLESSLLTCQNAKTHALLIKTKTHLEVNKLAFRTLAQKKEIIFTGKASHACPEFFINQEKDNHELLIATKDLGQGSFKRVVRAYNANTGKKLAVSIHIPENILTRGLAKGEYDSYQALKKKNVPSIVGLDLLKNSQAKEKIGFMRYCKGKNWWAQVYRLSYEKKVALFVKLANTIAKIHEAGYVHRDIKQGNIFFDGDEAVLGDFGLATRKGKIAVAGGTPGFVPPEIIHFYKAIWAVSTRQDAWAFGVMLRGTFLTHPDFRVQRAADGLLCINPQERMTLTEAHRILSQW